MKRALLLAKMDLTPESRNEEWQKWYWGTHVAARKKLPGWLTFRRFERVDGVNEKYVIPNDAKYLALYDCENVRALTSKAYDDLRAVEDKTPKDSFEHMIFKQPKFARGVYEEILPDKMGEYKPPKAPYVFIVGHDVPRGMDDEFNAWYNTEHLPVLMAAPGFLTARRFKHVKQVEPMAGPGGTISKYLTVYDMSHLNGFDTDVFRKAAASPWSQWVRSWYTRRICAIYKQIYSEK
jgi:hypothetical protein